MEKLKIAILGASGIGKFHAREFVYLGSNITSILGSSQESAEKTAQNLQKEFGIRVKPYSDLNLLLKDKIDAVSICTPLPTHYLFAKKCLENKLNVLCEKPFVTSILQAKELFNLARKARKKMGINMQWPAVLKELHYDSRVNYFEMRMGSGVKGIKILEEYLPHQNSLLIKLCGVGFPKEINFTKKNEEDVEIEFEYISKKGICKVKYTMAFKEDRPREIFFKINKKEFYRVVSENYSQKIISDGEEVFSGDPLTSSLKHFLQTVSYGKKPLISEKEVLANIELYNQIMEKYLIKN